MAMFTNFVLRVARNHQIDLFNYNTRDTVLPKHKDDPVREVNPEVLGKEELQAKPTLQEKYFKLGDELQFVKDDLKSRATLESTHVDKETGVQYFKLRLPHDQIVQTTKEHIRPLDSSDPVDIPITKEDFLTQAKELSAEDLEHVMKPSQLSPLETEFMHWHSRLNHLSFSNMHKLAEIGILPGRFKKLKGCTKLKCASCIFGRQKRRPWRTRAKPSTIRKFSDDKPGVTVSVDQVISANPGLVPRMSGRHTSERLSAVTVFYDHFSKVSYSHLQRSTDGDETLESKQAFEQFAQDHNVQVKAYRADNGRFAEQQFRDEVRRCNQRISFCGVEAHHQNGIIERHIQELTYGARTLLLHAKRHWPEVIGPLLWPYAWKAYEQIMNELRTNDNGKSPLQNFSDVDYKATLTNYHTWGCPVFVLKNPGQQPKWEPKSRAGIYLGHSPCHAGSVAMVLNPKTLHVSPQYHVVFDDEFTTVPFMRNGEIPPQWEDLVKKSSEHATNENFDLASAWTADHFDQDGNDLALDGTEDSTANGGEKENPSEDEVSKKKVQFADEEDARKSLLMPTLPDLDQMTLRRSPRNHPPSNPVYTKKTFMAVLFSSLLGFSVAISNLPTIPQRVAYHTEQANKLFDSTINIHHHMAFTTDVQNDFTYKEMLQQSDKIDFFRAMEKEVKDHEDRNHWSLVERSTLPPGTKTIMAIWSFKRKRAPDGRVLKHKARLCCHGGMQQWGVNYWETYAPVVNWFSIRMMLALSIIHDLESRSIDFTLAFPQADLDIDVYMELPIGFQLARDNAHRKYVLKLNKNLYGLKQAAYNWFEWLKKGLESRGFVQSKIDPCVFYKNKSILLVYVDDCIIFDPKQSNIDEFIMSLHNGVENFQLTDEGNIKDYLGVELVRHSKESYELHQPYLIQRILDVLDITSEHKTKPTPSVKPLLHRDLKGLERKHKWNYRQAVGMLGYLQGSSRPDIAMSVHQCARFNNNPMMSHERAIRRIGKYLLGTKDRGIIYTPDKAKGIEVYVDADFAGCWNHADSTNAENVLSRTGYVICYAGCPVIWSSRLQTEIALSTAEAEYIALSQAMRETIPVMNLLKEVSGTISLHMPEPEFYCKVFEDNQSCIKIATTNKFSPRTKHIALKYHHFRKYVDDKTIRIFHIETREQTADIFTKPLDTTLFEHLRKKLNGW